MISKRPATVSNSVLIASGALCEAFAIAGRDRAACRSKRALILVALLSWLGEAGPARAQGTTDTIAISGQSAPGAGAGTFSFFSGGPTLGNDGTAAFKASLTGGTAPTGIFSGSGGSVTNIALQGQSAPGTSGTLNSFAQPSIDNSGAVVFNAGVVTDGTITKGIYKGSGGSLAPIVLTGQSAPGTGLGTFGSGNTFSALNDSGTAAFWSSINGGSATEGLFKGSGSILANIALKGQSAPGTGAGTFLDFRVPEINGGGTVAFKANVTGGTASEGIFSGSGGSLSNIALKGQSAPGTGAGTLIGVSDFCALNDDGTVAFSAGVIGGTAGEGVFKGSGGALTNIALQGQSAPGTGAGGFSTFRTPALNDSGTVAFRANVIGGSGMSGIFKGSGGALTNIAVQGQSAPGTGMGMFSSFSDPALNSSGTAAFLASITGGTGSQGIYLGDGGAILLVAVVGQSLAGSTITSLTFVNGGPDGGPDSGGGSGLNDFGQVAYHAFLADGRNGMFLFSPAIPGDFDSDGDVDGIDFLKWQRGESPDPFSSDDLADWEAHYGTDPNPLAAATSSVPEPGSAVLAILAAAGLCHRKRQTTSRIPSTHSRLRHVS